MSPAAADHIETGRLAEATRRAFSIELAEPRVLRRGRALVARGGSVRGDVIVKRFEPAYREHFMRERAGLRVIGGLADLAGYVPRLLADDERELLLLIEAVPESISLETLLAGGDPLAAAAALVQCSERLGYLHGRARSLTVAFENMGTHSPSPGDSLAGGLASLLSFCQRALGEAASSELVAALGGLCQRVDRGGPLDTISVGDMAPSNVLFGSGGALFIDLEYCAVRNAFYDATFWRCICPFPSSVAERMDAGYSSGLREAGVDLDEASLRREALLFASHRLFWTLSWSMEALFEHDRDFAPGVSARAILRRYLEDYVELASRGHAPELAVLRDVAVRLAERLALAWPLQAPSFEFSCFARSREE